MFILFMFLQPDAYVYVICLVVVVFFFHPKCLKVWQVSARSLSV